MTDDLFQFFAANTTVTLTLFGLLIGFAFGALIEQTGFCAMGGVADAVMLKDRRRLRSWFLAAAVAILGVLALDMMNVTEFEKSRYLSSPLNLVSNAIGGVLFGVGMALCGGCVSKNLVRAGSGDIRSAIAVGVVAFFALITLTGLLGPLRIAIAQITQINPTQLGASSPAIPAFITATSLVSDNVARLLVPITIAAATMTYAFLDPQFRRSPLHVVSGVGVGLCVIAAWAVTGLAYDELALTPQPPISLSFVSPASETFEWMRRSTALDPLPNFAVASVLGTLLGAFISAKHSGRFRLATFVDVPDTARTFGGAALMGIGGVMAQGCTIGQAVTGVSTLALGSFVAFAGMISGTALCVKHMERQA